MACDGDAFCKYVVDVARLGDPAAGCQKDFSVDFQCGPNEPASTVSLPGEAGLGGVAMLDCRDPANAQVQTSSESSAAPDGDGRIQVQAGTFGGNCGAPVGNVTRQMSQACDGKTVCEYDGDTTRTVDPAPGCDKSLFAKYRCAPDAAAKFSGMNIIPGKANVLTLSCKK
jgi:hypothetical protein